ncbi:DUF5625 family protein [Pseudoduganella violacea]|uniref:DUF5625 domain-containing protein n=1 Tax=Pseudoduganella violacea TaxID=1715466 RepID=A0A7W5BFR3_9BURK|nr:DUF5625 family protein [Pseudoduganella violacea]MBB3122326.1 hypothetical protein [Pseudoduganella violacea]
MRSPERKTSAIRLLFAALVLLALGACTGSRAIPRPPLELPSATAQSGQEVLFEIEIIEKDQYLLGIKFLEQNTPGDAARLAQLLGASALDSSGKWIEQGVPASFQVRIRKKNKNEEILNELVDRPKTRAAYGGRVADISRINLEPGVYLVSLQYLRLAPALSAIPGKIFFSKAHHGK